MGSELPSGKMPKCAVAQGQEAWVASREVVIREKEARGKEALSALSACGGKGVSAGKTAG